MCFCWFIIQVNRKPFRRWKLVPPYIMRRKMLICYDLFIDYFFPVMICRPGPLSYFRTNIATALIYQQYMKQRIYVNVVRPDLNILRCEGQQAFFCRFLKPAVVEEMLAETYYLFVKIMNLKLVCSSNFFTTLIV
jgi:hypothetical protein